jgi:CO dehydrogenase nickel-insertion accessory protein CooC1
MNVTNPTSGTINPLAGQRLGVFGRGGSGKSTCVVLLAKALATAGYGVCVLDADSTNEGLAQALGADRTPDPLLDWLGGTVFSGGPVTCPVDDPMPLAGARFRLGQLPPRFVAQTPDGIWIFQAGKIGPLGLGAGCDGPMTKIARDFTLETDDSPPVTVVDFKAGIEDVSRGVITSLDWVIVVVDPSHAGVRAALTMKTLLDQMQAGHLPATRHLKSPELVELTRRAYKTARIKGVLYVLNKVPDANTEHFLRQCLMEANINVAASICEDSDLRQAWLVGVPLCSAPAEAEAAKIVRALEKKRGSFRNERPACSGAAAKNQRSPNPSQYVTR